MRYLKYAALLGALFGVLLFAPGKAQAQVRVGIGVGPVYGYLGPEPVCAYGYYPYYPYACAPSGYWGPSYFAGGVFIGAGPWYHPHWGPRYYGPRYYGRLGYGYRPGYAYRGAPAHGYAGGGFHGGLHGGGGRGR